MPAGSFTGSVNADGVAFSGDGNTWFPILSFTGTNSTSSYQFWGIDLRAAAVADGVALTADTRIRFQQFDNESLPNDGIALDNISFGVNQAPSFTKGANQSVNEDAGAQTVAGWATNISPGFLEGSQTVSFEIVSDSNPSLFAAGPAVDGTGKLTYTPAANANGTATIGIRARDTGGTAGGGVDVSPTQTFTITVNAVNDPPSFAKGADQAVGEDAGAQAVPNWATAISAGPPDESGQTLTFQIVSNTNPGLFGAGPAVSPTGTLTYTPAPNANGSATITVSLKDSGGGTDTSPTQTFTITVTPVNDPPSFAKGADQAVGEDAGAQAVPNWATAISAGPPDEAGQPLTFEVVSNSNPGLFGAGPAVAANGTLTYTPAANANGSATIAVRLDDNSGGTQTSPTQTFTITVTPVNDPPSFTAGGNQTVGEDAGAQAVPGWATGIGAGAANESGQALTFQVQTNNDALFAVLPAVDGTGTLTFTPAANANGSAAVTVRLHDDGGTVGGGIDTSPAQAFTITVRPVNDAPTFTAGPNVEVSQGAGAQTVAEWATNLSKGPPDEGGQALSFVIVSNSNPGLFAVQPTVSPAGTLRFTPAVGQTGTAAVQVSIRDDGGTANGGADTSPAQAFTITVDPVGGDPNAPVLSAIEAAPLAYAAGQGPVAVTQALTVADADSTTLIGATVRIAANYTAGQDFLRFTDQGGIAGAFNAATGVLTLTGPATLAVYQAALRSVAYEDTAGTPATATRTVSFQVTDPTNKLSNTQSRDIAVSAGSPGGTIGFGSAAFGAAEGIPLTIMVRRIGGTSGAASVQYATADGTATAGSDYTAVNGTLNWADGDGADKPIPLTIAADGLSEGAETIRLTLSTPTGAAAGQLDTVIAIAKSDPKTLTPAARSTAATDADGDAVTVTLGGKVGRADVYLTNGGGPVQEVDLSNTSPASSTLTVAVKRSKLTNGDGRTGLGAVTGSGLKALSAKAADLTGAGIDLTGPVGSIALGAVRTGADIRVAGTIGKLTAGSVGRGTIAAAGIGSAIINGNFSAAVALDGTAAGPGKPALGTLKVAGNILDSDIRVRGDVGAVQALGFTRSQLFAGYDGSHFGPVATIKAFTVTGIFADSLLAASAFGRVTLRSVDSDNGGNPFGVRADMAIGSLSVSTPGFRYNRLGPADQGVDDFRVMIV